MSNYFVGAAVNEVDTPALMVNLDVLEGNIEKAAAFFRDLEVGWRPHTKGQKVPAIAHREIEAGALGITCAKLEEAEVMVAAGIKSVLIANQVVGPYKTRRLASLCRQAEVMAAVDSLENARQLDEAGRDKGVRVPVLVEVDIGMNRCGTQPGEATVQLSEQIHRMRGLRYRGVMGWEGHARRFTDPDERKSVCEESIGLLVRSAQLCRQCGLPVEIVSCGGTGTQEFSSRVPGITEIQAGGIIFNDMYYSSLDLQHDFALTVMSTVISRPDARRIVTDSGKKAMSSDTAVPRPIGVEGIESVRFSAEHGVITVHEPVERPGIGDRLEWIIGYGDTTVSLHDEMYGVRDGRVEVVWPIWGRGKIR
ncbi:MAG: DSD1 family PLP-dependent enzyme [Bacillota bacterium]